MIDYDCECGDGGPHPVVDERPEGTIIFDCRACGARVVLQP